MIYAIVGIVLLVIIMAFLITSFVVYRMAYARNDKIIGTPLDFPDSEFYTPYAEEMTKNIKIFLDIPYEEVYITSHDGLKLHGKFYEGQKDKPVIIFFHGYRANATRDGSGIHTLGTQKGLNILTITQRSHKESEGKTITFGIKEHRDCLCWIQYCNDRFGSNRPIILSGLSMGAATVLMAAKRSPSASNAAFTRSSRMTLKTTDLSVSVKPR